MTETPQEFPQEFPLERDGFREVVRHPAAHAVILAQYRVGEHAGVVALKKLLGEIEPEAKLRRAMEIHHRDEARHSQLFGDWIRRLGLEPPPLPEDVEGFFATSPEEFREHRRVLDTLPPALRRIIVFAAINAIERLAYTQFEGHLLALERPEDVSALEGVMAEEKFHLSYVEAELDRQSGGPNGNVVTMALDQARARFAEFRQMRETETRQAIERLLGASPR
jgi:rubrerythrin